MIRAAARIGLIAFALFAPAALLDSPVWAAADTSCDDGRGIGGTGYGDGRGIGGTGHSDGRGIGGTGRSDGRGIGGTGMGPDDDDDRGIGGTGFIGPLTSIDEFCVNGTRLHLDDDTVVVIDGRRAAAGDLGIGSVITATARLTDSGWIADRIASDAALVGPVARVGENWIEVLGRRVELAGDVAERATFAPGETVRIDGLWQDDESLAATRVTPSASLAGRFRIRAVLAAQADRVATFGAGTAVSLPHGVSLSSGSLVDVAGSIDGRVLTADAAATVARLGFADRVSRVSIESFMTGAGRTQLSGLGVSIDRAAITAAGTIPRGVVRVRAGLSATGAIQAPVFERGAAIRTQIAPSMGTRPGRRDLESAPPPANQTSGTGDAPKGKSGAPKPPPKSGGGNSVPAPPRHPGMQGGGSPPRPPARPARPGPPRIPRPPR